MGGIEDFMRSKSMQVSYNGKEFNLPKILILMRHGEETNQSTEPTGELTPLGRKQIWSTTWQLLDKIGQSIMNNTEIISSQVYRVLQSANIVVAAIGSGTIHTTSRLEWGPDDGHRKDEAILKRFSTFSDDLVIIAIGHNGLFENIANIIHPRSEGWQLPPGHAFIITAEGIEIISPQV